VNRIVLVTGLMLVMLMAMTLAADASPTRQIQYVRVGQSTDGQPVYMALVPLKYMDSALGALLFGGQAFVGQQQQQYGPMTYRPSAVQGARGTTDLSRSSGARSYQGYPSGRYQW
jgi:hypothetical protein